MIAGAEAAEGVVLGVLDVESVSGFWPLAIAAGMSAKLGMVRCVLTRKSGMLWCLDRLARSMVISVARRVLGLHSVVSSVVRNWVSLLSSASIVGSVERLISIVSAFWAMGYVRSSVEYTCVVSW